MTLEQLISQLGINLASSAIFELIKIYFVKENDPTTEGLKETLASHLQIENADIAAENIVQFLATNGNITISGTKIYASKEITMASSKETSFEFGNNSSSKTDTTSVEAGHGAILKGQGGARIVQGEDGSIRFLT
jgi:ribosomal protein S24E